jgi:hypothetical protein
MLLKEIIKLFEIYFHKKEVKNICGKELEVRMQELPEYLRREVLDYIDFLSIKYKGKLRNENKFVFDWEGGLLEVQENFTSVELQHKSMEWR